MSYKGNTIYKWNNAFEGKFPTEGDLNEKLIVESRRGDMEK